MILAAILAWSLAGEPFPFAKEEAEISAEIRTDELKAHVYRLASPEFLGRRGDGGDRAAQHLAATFARIGLKPAFGESFFQPIPWLLTTPAKNGQSAIGRNVGGFIPGTDPQLADEWIILAAHYDHLGMKDGVMYPGADDNGSGVAMLLEVAEAMCQGPHKPKRSVYFLSFDLEESGLQGSTHFAAHPPRDFGKLKAFLVADLLGRSMADVMDEYMFVLGSETSNKLRRLVADTPTDNELKTGRLGADLVGTRSDYGPFRDRQVPFLFFTTGVHKDYHRPTDLPDRLNYGKLARESRWITTITQQLADAADPPIWQPDAVPPDLDEVETVKTLMSRALERPAVVAMSDEKRKRMTEARDRLAGIAERKTITPDERAWLVNTARWAMLNVF